MFQRLMYSQNDFSLVPKRPKEMQKTFSRKMGPTRTFYDRRFSSYSQKTKGMSFFFYHSCGGCFLISVFTQNGQRNDFNVWFKSHIDAKFQGESNGEIHLALSSLENEILAKNEHMSKTHLQQLGP